MNQENKSQENTKNYSKTDKRLKRSRKCRFCGTNKGLVRKYNLYICRRCFKDNAEELGFKKLD